MWGEITYPFLNFNGADHFCTLQELQKVYITKSNFPGIIQLLIQVILIQEEKNCIFYEKQNTSLKWVLKSITPSDKMY